MSSSPRLSYFFCLSAICICATMAVSKSEKRAPPPAEEPKKAKRDVAPAVAPVVAPAGAASPPLKEDEAKQIVDQLPAEEKKKLLAHLLHSTPRPPANAAALNAAQPGAAPLAGKVKRQAVEPAPAVVSPAGVVPAGSASAPAVAPAGAPGAPSLPQNKEMNKFDKEVKDLKKKLGGKHLHSTPQPIVIPAAVPQPVPAAGPVPTAGGASGAAAPAGPVVQKREVVEPAPSAASPAAALPAGSALPGGASSPAVAPAGGAPGAASPAENKEMNKFDKEVKDLKKKLGGKHLHSTPQPVVVPAAVPQPVPAAGPVPTAGGASGAAAPVFAAGAAPAVVQKREVVSAPVPAPVSGAASPTTPEEKKLLNKFDNASDDVKKSVLAHLRHSTPQPVPVVVGANPAAPVPGAASGATRSLGGAAQAPAVAA